MLLFPLLEQHHRSGIPVKNTQADFLCYWRYLRQLNQTKIEVGEQECLLYISMFVGKRSWKIPDTLHVERSFSVCHLGSKLCKVEVALKKKQFCA